MKIKDLTGQTFGRLLVQSIAGKDKRGRFRWECLCSCSASTKVVVSSSHLVSGHTISCGCVQKEAASLKQTSHGRSKTRTYRIWAGMLNRCLNPKNTDYKSYGGLGVTVHSAWLKFEKFLLDNGDCPLGMSVDRFPNQSGNYEPGNVRWASPSQQANNRKNNVLITIGSETKSISQWAHGRGIKPGTVWARLHSGWTVEEALSLY